MVNNEKNLSEGKVYSGGGYEEFAREYHSNPDLRHELQVNPNGVVAKWGFPVQADTDVHIAVNTDETFHLVFPEDPNVDLSDESLQGVTGGTAGGFLSSVSTLISCASTASSN